MSYFIAATVLATLALEQIRVNRLRIKSGWILKEEFKPLGKRRSKTTFYYKQ